MAKIQQKTVKEASKSDNRPTLNLSTQILHALTQQEIAQLIDALFGVLSSQQTEQAIAQLSANTQQIIQQILTPSSTVKPTQSAGTQTVSLAKQAQTWSKLWKDWNAIVKESERERGKYFIQDAHWEPPYFDTTTFAEDLDEVAGKMRPLLQIAFEQKFTPNKGFIPALLEAEAGMTKGFDDWMEITDGLYLEDQLTYCVFQWEWLTVQKRRQNAFELVQRIRQCEKQFQQIAFDDDVVLDFLTQLSESDQQHILAGLTADKETSHWKEVLSDTASPWHQLYLDLVEQYAPELYLDNLRATIPQQWQNGLLIIEALLVEQNYAESLVVIEETLKSLLKLDQEGNAWTPETSLLIVVISGFHRAADQESVTLLLRNYHRVVQELNQIERANALEIQLIAIAQYFNWTVMFKTFAEIPVSASTHQALLTSWKNYIAQKSKPNNWNNYRHSTVEPWWLLWLIDSLTDPKKGKIWFQQQITHWLTHLPEDKNQLGENYALLRLLTKDLTEIQSKAKIKSSVFYQVVIVPNELSTHDDQSRQEYLKQYAPTGLLEQVMTYWKTHLQNFVPRPELVQKADYTEAVRWMMALSELSPRDYKDLLNQWRVAHQRRTNLWKAMEKAGLN